ncbi:hypothetical protein AB0910_17110 [Streptomyces sp. NPDC047002]|uniref:hypothetical protein n=1 Tax=Streptomyces sp. NPDC047002 TaxID=3155475 RepID=UPI0034522CDA
MEDPVRKVTIGLGVLLLITALTALTACSGKSSSKSSGRDGSDGGGRSASSSATGSGGGSGGGATDSDAEEFCEFVVSGKFASPLEAEFPAEHEDGHATTTVDSDTRQYRVTGVAYDHKSPGVKVRKRYTCTLTSKGMGVWHVDNLKITPRRPARG